METTRYRWLDKAEIIDVLLKGGLVAFPTDTVFGLACAPEADAINRVYEVKGRSFSKPLPMMCCDQMMIREVAYVSETAEKIMNAFVPGPLTLIFKKKEGVADIITQGRDTIGIRVPDDDDILELIRMIGRPLLVTSANISGSGSLLKWADVYECMQGKIEGIVCEDAKGEQASTIIDVSGEIKVLREGPLRLSQIMEVI